MITSIFSKSKPVNFLVVFVILIFTFSINFFNLSNESYTTVAYLKFIGLFLVVYISILLLNFIVSKNSLTKKNNYEILLFSLFLLLIPESVIKWETVASNFFILLALRRVISLRSQIEIMKKLFDAGFWVGLATLFYFWSILFFIVIIAALIFFSESKLRYWIIPLTGACTVFLLTSCYSLFYFNDLQWFNHLYYSISFDFNKFNTLAFIVSITVLLSFGIWSSFFYLKNLKSKMKTLKPGFKIILTAFIIAWSIIIITPDKNGSEFLFLFAPLSIIITNYIETIKEKWFKEVFLATFIVIPVVLLFL